MDPEFARFLSSMNAREQRERELAAEQFQMGTIPTTKEVRQLVNSSVGNTRALLLSNHKFSKEKTLRVGFQTLIASMNAAFTDLCKLEAAIAPHYYQSKEDNTMEYVVSTPIQKEVIAFCSAAHGIVDVTRRIKAARPDLIGVLENLRSELVREKNPSLIFDLRKNLSHGSVVIPYWNITSDDRGIRGSILLEIPMLLKTGDWSENTKSYFSLQKSGQINLKAEMEQYLSAINRYSADAELLFASSATAEEQDYYDIEDEYQRRIRTQHLRIIIGQGRQFSDPLKYLGRFFTEEQARAIRKLPTGSNAQLDLIAALKSTEYDIDDKLREEVRLILSPEKE